MLPESCKAALGPLVDFLERMKEGDNPRTMPINTLDLWVQLHGMHAGFMAQRVVKDVGNYIGKFIESDTNNFVGVWREYLRVRVKIDLTVPLKRRMKLRKSQSECCWANFRNEGVPTFWFICGMIGHGEKFCEKLFDTPLEDIEKPYGAWMKAEPRRRNHTMGAKWLRQGGKNPVSFPGTTTGDSEGGIVATKSAETLHDPMIVGNKTDRVVTSSEIVTVNISDSGEKIGDNNAFISNNICARKIGYASEVNGLEVLDPKRRRIEEPIGVGLGDNNSPEDADMTDTGKLENASSKNEFLAGSAMQTRLSS